MDSNLEICFADIADVSQITDIMAEAYRQMEHPEWFCTDDMEFLERHVCEEGFILKAEVSGELAGFLMIRYPGTAGDNLGCYLGLTDEEKALVAHMESAVVKAAYRGRGIQRKLMEKGGEILWERGYCYLMGTAHPDNRYSVNNFLALGYEIVAEDVKYGGLPRYVFCRRKEK